MFNKYTSVVNQQEINDGLKPLLGTKAAATLSDADIKAIQTRIDELQFVLGYTYRFEARPDALPQLQQASYEAIYVNLSAYKKVKRLPKIEATENEVSTTSIRHLSIEHASTDERTLFLPIDDTSTLYVTVLSETTVQVSFGNDIESSDSRVFVLDTTTNADLANLISLLPDEGHESFNPTLLRKLSAACQLNPSINDNILFCTVRHYDGNYKTIKVTAKDLEIESINQDFKVSDDTATKIIDMLVKAKYANRGFAGMDPSQQILPDTYKQAERRRSYCLLFAALLLELAYTYLQYTSSYIGWLEVIGLVSVATLLSIIGTGFDFGNNVWGVLVDNHAINLALRKLAEMSPAMSNVASIVNVANDISFIAGGAGNALGILVFIDPLYQQSPEAFYAVAGATVALVSYIGREYYAAFNIRRLVKSLNDLSEHFSAVKAGKTDHDAWHERDIAIAIWSAIVITFRSIGFGGIAVLIALALHITNGWVNLAVGFTATLATAISILFTRTEVIFDYWSNNEFAYLRPAEKNAAWKALTLEPKKIISALLTLDTAETIAMAIGFLCLTEFQNNLATYIAATLAVLLITVMCKAQILREINIQALEKLEKANIKVKEREGLPEKTKPPEVESEIDKQKKAADLIFATMQKPYLEWPTEKLAYLTSIPVIATLFVGISVLNRGLGFLGYVDTVNRIMAPIITFILDHLLQAIGIFLIFAPKNIENMFTMFYENMTEDLAQKSLERDITVYNKPESLTIFSIRNPFSDSAYRRTIAEVKDTVGDQIEKLQDQLPTLR